MATKKVCDRCMNVLEDDEQLTLVSFAMGLATGEGESEGKIYTFGPEELCPFCAQRVLKLAKDMKLGDDAVPGGVRIKKPKKTAKAKKKATSKAA